MGRASAHEAQYAAGAILLADRSPKPPSLIGKEAMRSAVAFCALSPSKPPRTSSITFIIPSS